MEDPRKPEPWVFYCRNRVLIISLALAGSGILTCGLALSDILLPRGSAIVVLASIPLLGAIVLGVMIVFAWTCDLLDQRDCLRVPEPIAGKPATPWQIVSAQGANLASLGERQPESKTSKQPLRPLIDYPVKLRGRVHFQGSRWGSGRRDQ